MGKTLNPTEKTPPMNTTRYFAVTLVAAVGSILAGLSSTQAEVSKGTLDAISIPDKVETSIGTLDFFDGVPSDVTIDKLYDNLDRMRGVQVK